MVGLQVVMSTISVLYRPWACAIHSIPKLSSQLCGRGDQFIYVYKNSYLPSLYPSSVYKLKMDGPYVYLNRFTCGYGLLMDRVEESVNMEPLLPQFF